MDFRSFLKSKREALGLSQNKFSKMVGITQSYYNGVERGEIKNPPSEEVIEKFISTLLLTPEEGNKLRYLAAIERTPDIILEELEKLTNERTQAHQKAVREQSDKDALIPLFSRISAGVGAVTDEEPVDYISLPGIRNIESIFAINVKGDSMEPTIKDQSIILCKQNGEIRDGDVAAFLVNGESYVKRIKVNSNFIALLSDNPNYQPIYVYPDDEFRVIGKVFKVINDVK
ncbi:LexA repressor [Fusobacterium sp. DD29]|uniref:LexA family transcriptional regulator n=1 Tax=unclassified Fusobacterium TaxID=2648384 RepID=UPI001B8D81C0|nr:MULTISPECIES: LexA family transcriptional regulator [unclassified Fusobacterium]MBR8701636.1 LexA repressor [Fusobacterium sp. DD45]MBR8711417.1 LexA repressor [Fusobacterium sp. DD28]MBR8750523.1 LexA repressor [Fusobacterium sp. DD29]MBR8751954.1 LexA repressor [Fusobacterium sp. DD26]MBR8762769.1 LexA repressor [Fusobacterium sp. DD25]